MSDEPRPESRTPVLTVDRQGRLVRFQELTAAEIAALRDRLAGGDDPSPAGFAAPPATDAMDLGGRVKTHTYTYTYVYNVDDAPPPMRFEHDPAARVFRLTAADGTVEVFRGNPTRYLYVEPESDSGAMRPVVKRRRPVYLYLCREDREAR